MGLVTSTTGLTVGDLYDVAEKTWRNHLMCPHASSNDHDDNGEVNAGVTFGCRIRAKADDPFFKPSEPEPQEFPCPSDKETQITIAKNRTMKQYVEAKLRGEAWLL